MADADPRDSFINDLLILDDPQDAQKRLEEDADRLFVAENALKVLVWPDNNDNKLSPITDATFLRDHIEQCLREKRTSILILQQEHTWSRILISLECFKTILAAFGIFAPFVEFVTAFGLKVSESDENFSTFRQRTSSVLSELCYNLRYPEKTQRSKYTQWSMRHVAAYYQYEHKSGVSRWLLVQPSEQMKQKFNKIIQKNGCLSSNPIIAHLAILLSSERGWRGYINDLQEQFNELDYKARFFKHAICDDDSFYVRLGDSQLLHSRRQKLLKSFAILESCISIARGCNRFCGDLDKMSSLQTPPSAYIEIELYITRVEAHKRAVNLLLAQSAGTLKLLFQVLQFRNDEALAKSNTLMEHNSNVLADLGINAREENQALIVLTKQGRKDSRSMKILTFIAMLYLPASLVAGIFNSNLIASVKDGEASTQTHFSLVPQFWIYPIITIALMCISTIPLIYFESIRRKKGSGIGNAP